ncbi:LPS assembly protein LptD [Rhodanobacter sp. DHG33]|uniref:LPS assembly protein LptD n=1 Tax=Rhodanobacter sp. DHG33 TaxID=2775921 RepID=UPI00178224AC|nr:LPS assembly protein LptD [Rhodanobacter sp. DHG33]
MTRKLPPRRLLAVAAALALIGGPAEAGSGGPHRSTSLDGSEQACPLGSFTCPPRPYNYVMCHPNAMLEFYDPTLSKDSGARETSKTYVSAKHVDSADQTVYHLTGDVRMDRADQRLQADTVDYNDDTTDYDARGNVRYQDYAQLMSSTHARGNDASGVGIADDVRYQMLTSRGNGVARQAQELDVQHTRYTQATYSTCDVGHHLWEFRGQSIVMDKVNGVGVARDSTFRVGNVPLLYLPWFSFPLDNRRKTGFLYPVIGHSGHSGYVLSAPFYLNLAPNYDATLDPRIYTSRGVMLDTEFRYLLPGSNGTFDVQYLPNDHGTNDVGTTANTPGTDRYRYTIKDTTHLWGSWNFTTSIDRSSDNNFFYDFGNQLGGPPIYILTSNAQVAGSGKWGTAWWNASVGGDAYQNMNPFLTDASLPYRQLPYGNFNFDWPINNWLEFGMNNQFVAFRKPGYVEGNREDLQPYLAADFGTQGWFVRPRVEWRYTDYQLSNGYQQYGYFGLLGSGLSSPFTQQSPSRSMPIVDVDSGLVFDRNISLFGNDYTQTLEPRLYYLYAPYRDQNNLPLFDSALMTFDYWQLFSTNQFAGADRQMNANNLTAAITTRLLDDSGVEQLSASFGQIRYFTPQRVQMPIGSNTVAPITDWSGSAYVAQIDMQLNDRWRASTSYQWSPNTHDTQMAMFQLQGRVGTDGIINFAYRYRQGLMDQYTVSGVYPLSDRWRLIGSWTYAEPLKGVTNSLKGTIEAVAGVEYDSCCVTLQLVDRSYVNQGYYGVAPTVPVTGPANLRDNVVMFQVIFKGLGSTSGQIDPLLRRDILGYQ